jgi:hypothetical protein
MTGTSKAKSPASRPGIAAMLIALAAGLGGLHAGGAQAELVSIDDQVAVRPSDINRPARGMTMSAVEAKFGAPQQRHPAVGEPPITRWDYQSFSVYFEKDRVIDAVVAPAAPIEASVSAASS